MTPKVFVVILNWNRFDDTKDCLDSVLSINITGFDLNIIIVDNNSDTNTVKNLEKLVSKYTSKKTS